MWRGLEGEIVSTTHYFVCKNGNSQQVPATCLTERWNHFCRSRPIFIHLHFHEIIFSFRTAKWIWDISIYSIINPSFDMTLFQYFWRFTQICKKFAAFARKIVFFIVSEQFYYRKNNKNNFASKCCKFLANLCKSSEILEQCYVKWWLKYRYNRSVSWRLRCK